MLTFGQTHNIIALFRCRNKMFCCSFCCFLPGLFLELNFGTALVPKCKYQELSGFADSAVIG